MFRKYHYLDHDISKSGVNYVGLINNISVVFISIIHFPHPQIKNLKKVHRIVVLPDYQGVGIGVRFLDFMGEIYKKNWIFGITTSNSSLVFSLKKNKRWRCIFSGRMPKIGEKTNLKSLKKTASNNRLTTSWFYDYSPQIN